jgi:TPR repeat protein
MFKRLLLTVTFIFSISTLIMAAQVPAASEKDVYRPDKGDIIAWMNQASKMPAAQQNESVDDALKNVTSSGGKAPRSDFQLCVALAYLGNAKAQRCVALAYEKGAGIVDDPLEAYVWFELAHGSGNTESAADVSRIILILNSAYPAPTEEELETMVSMLKGKVAEYQKEVKK